MLDRIRVDYSMTAPFLDDRDWAGAQAGAVRALATLEDGRGPGAAYLGWLRYPETVAGAELEGIEQIAREVREEAEALVVVGIGGSYLGARAVIECFGHAFSHLQAQEGRRRPQVVFAGQNLSSSYLEGLLEALERKSFYVNVISKSGTTTEPGLAFRLLRRILLDRYGREGAARRILSTTDGRKGALRALSEREGYRTFVIPDDIGGRYSVLTPVGLLPMAVAGVPPEEVLAGARSMIAPCAVKELLQNPAALYAAGRDLLWRKGYHTEILVAYDPRLQSFAEWWKQLFGESEGKEGKGIFPASAVFTTDLHSLGQWIQEGPRTIFETLLHVEDEAGSLRVPEDPDARDELEYLAGRAWTDIQQQAAAGTRLAHHQGGVPVFSLEVPRLSPYHLGQLIYFFEKACGISGTLLGVNPFDQPGVEAYKQNVFALLGKPGTEQAAAQLAALMRAVPKGKVV
ncbi:MAG: glucose-6-phosphate isomerase [bacterium]